MRHAAFAFAVGFTLVAPTVESGDPLKDAVEIARWLTSNGRDVDGGRVWPIDPEKPDEVVAHLYSGTSGVVLFFIEVHRLTGDPSYLEEARAGADYLVANLPAILEVEGAGLYTGLAGVGFVLDEAFGATGDFFAELYEETGEKRFLDAALSGAEYLKSIADVTGDACLIFHHESEDSEKSLYYLSWCHGPAGTARLFYQLFRVTNDPEWMTWVEMSARGILASGIPERRASGFWNNISQCCGSAGVAEFFLSLHQVTANCEYLEFAERVSGEALSRATRDEHGLRFVQAENRTQPELLQAQTGYMQGAAGVGLWLLRLHAFSKGEKAFVVLPDSPFGS